MEQKIRLSIIIPTYNRNKILAKNINHLLPQLNESCELVILDNCNKEKVEVTLVNILNNYKSVKVVRNTVNIGGNANVMRAFEYGEGEYLWILGDDDKVKGDSISLIFKYIDDFPDAIFFNFNSIAEGHHKRLDNKISKNLDEFLESVDTLGQLIFISTNIYKTSHFKDSYRIANLYLYTNMPQFIIVIMSLSYKDNMTVISKDQIVDINNFETDLSTQASTINIALGFPIILDLPLDLKYLNQIKLLIVGTMKSWITPRGIFHQLILSQKSKRENVYLLNLLNRRFFSLNNSFILKLQISIMKLLIIFPFLGKVVLSLMYKIIKNKDTGEHNLRNRDNV